MEVGKVGFRYYAKHGLVISNPQNASTSLETPHFDRFHIHAHLPFLSCRYDHPAVPTHRISNHHNVQLLILAAGYPQAAQVFFWIWKEDFPQRRHSVCDLLWRLPNEVVPLVYPYNIPHSMYRLISSVDGILCKISDVRK